MVKEQIIQGFSNLTEEQVKEGYNVLINRLIKLGKVSTPAEGQSFITKTLTVLLTPELKGSFLEGFDVEADKWRDKESQLQWSIYAYFKEMDNKKRYEQSGLKAAVHNAKGIINQMPNNSKLTLN